MSASSMDPSSCSLQTDDENTVLEALLEAFHPSLSLQDIASAYCSAGSDLNKAVEILCRVQKSNADAVQDESDYGGIEYTQSEESVSGDSVKGSNHFSCNKASKPKKISATTGTVSTLLGKAYARSTPSRKEMVEATKPLKIEVSRSAVDGLDTELKANLDRKDMEEFLISMLGNGSELDMDVICDVLGHCSSDVKKTMEELFGSSQETLCKGKRIDNDISESLFLSAGTRSESEHHPLKDIRKAREATIPLKENSDIPRELLVSLFNAPDLFEEEPKQRLEWGLNRTRVVGQKAVTKPLDDFVLTPVSGMAATQPKDENDEDDTYWMLRRDVKEHWDKMKEFYKAALEAYASGDRSTANDLFEQGRHHNQMAREADEKSVAQILETKQSHTLNDVPLDLHSYSAKDSILLLKKHLVLLAKIPDFRYLRIIINTDAEDTTKGKRKKLVLKYLERKSIKWIEDEKPGTILVELDAIDMSRLTSADDRQ